MRAAFRPGNKGGLAFEIPGADPDPMTVNGCCKKAEFSINPKKDVQRVDISNSRRGTLEREPRDIYHGMLVLLYPEEWQ